MTRTVETGGKENGTGAMTTEIVDRPRTRRGIATGIWVLGFVSMLMDISSEMIHALLPIYMVAVLGTSALTVGIIEGIAEATASIRKVFSGALSDWLGKRKFLAALGYGLAAFTKPIFPLASSISWLIVARFIDRVGKGIRGAPRDALVADISPAHLRGASFGLRQSLDTIGAFLGPLLAIGLMWLTADHFSAVFWVAGIPGLLSFLLFLLSVQEPKRREGFRLVCLPPPRAQLARLATASLGGVAVLIIGLLLLLAADLVLAFVPRVIGLGLGVVLWGLHMGFTQGLLATLVADTAPPELRGTAFGMLNLITGLALLVASVIAGALWDVVGPQGTFLAGAVFTVLTLAGLLPLRGRLGRHAHS